MILPHGFFCAFHMEGSLFFPHGSVHGSQTHTVFLHFDGIIPVFSTRIFSIFHTEASILPHGVFGGKYSFPSCENLPADIVCRAPALWIISGAPTESYPCLQSPALCVHGDGVQL